MRKVYLLLTLFILFRHSVAAGNDRVMIGNVSFKNATVKRDPDPAPYADFKTLVVPIKRAGNLIIVEAQVDSLEGNFVLDTGAPYLVLNATYFRYIPEIADQEAGGINGESKGAFTTYVHNFKILDLQYSRLTADVTDLSSIENGKNIKILGLLGTRLFEKFSITVDLFNNVLYIQKVDKSGNVPEGEKIFHDRLMFSPFKYINSVIFLKGTVNNNTYWFGFDTAAETNLLDYDRFKKTLKDLQIISRSKINGIGGKGLEVLYARFDGLTVGDHTFEKNRTLITDLEKMGKAYGSNIDGILGYDFFVRGIFTINFVKKEFEMYIYNNK
ncbi:MAG: retropepsin-like domain-containing protein [Bacteroidota bacterium]|nr:retropepsin-like domain-containing protein [Bacteroidota bacterium]